MNTNSVQTQDGVFKRVLLLYGLFMLLSNAAYLLAYYLLPEGFLRGSPVLETARVIASSSTFWSQLALTFLGNLGIVTALSVCVNLFRVKGFSLGYIWPIFLAIQSGVVAGTNSFFQSDLTQINVRYGMAMSLSIGGLEFLAYILIIASTVSLVIYQFSSWTQLRPTKLKNLRDIRLSRAEVLCLIGGIALLFVAAYRETVLSVGL
jgi:cytochrome c oxidase subunit IV